MRRSLLSVAAAALAGLASAQETQTYCDDLGRCFASYTSASGVTFGIAIPEVSEAPFDAILQITAPIETGWAGFSWGGSMTYVPLTLTWPNDGEFVASSRAALSYSLPPVYENATVRVLEGSYVNDTHWVSTTFCSGCSTWEDLGSSPDRLDPTVQQVVAYAWGSSPVNNPADEDSTFSIHDEALRFGIDLSLAQSPDFADWIGEEPEQPPPTTTTTSTGAPPTPTTTSPPPPPPTGEIPFPETCNLEGQFPLEVAEGWKFVKLAGDLSTPRGVTVDTNGNLLLVEVGRGLSVHTFGSDGCIASSKLLIDQPRLTHGVALTPDGATLYVSSIDTVWRYSYDTDLQEVADQEVVVADMYPASHSTRTVVVPPATPNLIVVSLGSDGNLDWESVLKETGRAIVKVFDMSELPEGGFDYSTEGWFLGYGLRNEVALAVDNNNMVWGVENSADNFVRVVDGVETDIVEDNPAEELNYLGDPSVSNEQWYGYPTCFTVWGGELFPDGNPAVGSQFLPAPNDTFSDATCEELSQAPRLSIQAHSAPLDAKFDPEGENLFVTLHGSWNREVPTGYKVVTIPFTTNSEGGYEPVAAADSREGYDDILWDPQEDCNSSKCFRPSGLTWDRDFSRLIIASDNSQQGELYLLARV